MSYTARATIDLLKDTFGDRLISHFEPVNWSPRSCDLTPLDYFLGGYVKSLVYADKPQTLDHLEDNIRRVIADIRPQMKPPQPQKCHDGYMKPLVVNKDEWTVIRSQVVSARAEHTPHSRTTRGRTDDFSGATARNSAIPCVKGDSQECCLYLKRSA
ncbi:hypothetical protein TNCV_4830011 [Trichonephila clavipes]|nr:hypothetical protein TNCV_4830011 [Trichonephila clavipes]